MRLIRDDGGFSLIDVSVGAVLAAIVGTLFLSTLVSAQKAEDHLVAVSASQEDLRRALIEVLQDVRTAEPLWFDASTTPAPHPQQELRLVQRQPGQSPTYVRWHVSGNELVRDVVTENAFGHLGVVATTYRLGGVDASLTSFAYDTRGGAVPLTGTIDWNQLNRCTVRVTVVLRAAPFEGRHPVSVTSQAQLRNNAEPPVFCP